MTLLTEGQTTFPFGVQQCGEFFLGNGSSVEKKRMIATYYDDYYIYKNTTKQSLETKVYKVPAYLL